MLNYNNEKQDAEIVPFWSQILSRWKL